MKKNFFTLMLCLAASNFFAQDWLQNSSSLYYYSSKGEKVYMEPDYSSMAVYFKNTPSEKSMQSFNSKISLFKSSAGSLPKSEMLGNKGVMCLKSSDGLMSIKTMDERKSFLSTYSLDTEEAYDVLPAFTIEGGGQAWLTKRVSIKLLDGVTTSEINTIISKYGAEYVRVTMKGKMVLLEVEAIESQLPMIQELAEANLIDWGTPDFKMEIKKYEDPLYQYQWHLNNTGGTDYSGENLVSDVDIDAPEAWEITTGSPDITVAVIDDGMNAHEDFPNLLPGYTPANNGDGTPEADGAHGVACGGLIFAQHNDIGVMGVAPDVNAFSVNIFASGTTNADLADAVIWAVDQGADVLSNSWGFGGCYPDNALPSLNSAFSYAATDGRDGLGCVVLVASGNDFMDCVSYPASMASVTAVGAVDGTGIRSVYSNYGSTLDITAPSNTLQTDNNGNLIVIDGFYQTASNIVTTDVEGSLGYVTGNYEYDFGGTSAATPIAAGVAALVLSVDPTLTKEEVEDILYDSAVDYGSNGFDNEYGHGLVNAYNAVVAAGGTPGGGGSTGDNLALGKNTDQSTTTHGGVDSRAVDGDTNGVWTAGSVTHTASGIGEWWLVELGSSYPIGDIDIYNRTDSCCMFRLDDITVTVEDANENILWSQNITSSSAATLTVNAGGVSGSVIRITQNQAVPLSLAEVEVYEYDGTASVFPDPSKTYYIDSAYFDYRIAATGESEEPYTASTSTTGTDVEWVFVDKGNGYWHIQRAAGGSLPRLRTDNSEFADMQGTAWSGIYTYYELTEGFIEGSYFVTLPDGPTSYKRLQINSDGVVRMVSEASANTWESFTFTEVENPSSSSLTSSEIAGLTLYPNEVSDVLNISFAPTESVSRIEIKDMYGQTLSSESMSGSKTSFDVGSFNSGLYLVRFFEGDQLLETKRIIKK